MLLDSTVARVESERRSIGTAFLVGERHAATAFHVLKHEHEVRLVFDAWTGDKTREAKLIWNHDHEDVAILELDRPAPDGIRPLPWSDQLEQGDRWQSIGYPNRHLHAFHDEPVEHPNIDVRGCGRGLIQLGSKKALDGLNGTSGAPCVVDGAVVGLISFQLLGKDEKGEKRPAFQTLYAFPIAVLQECKHIAAPQAQLAEHVPLEESVIPIDSLWYVRRNADLEALHRLSARGSMVILFGPKKTGKTSLLERLASDVKENAAKEGTQTKIVRVDFEELHAVSDLTAHRFFADFSGMVLSGLGKNSTHADRVRDGAVPIPDTRDLMEELVLSDGKPIYLSIDNLSVLSEAPSVFADFQRALSAWGRRPAWRNVRWAIACTSSTQLFEENGSPIGNLGHLIEMGDFTDFQLRELFHLHGLEEADEYLEQFHLTVGGHPYLSRRLMFDAHENEIQAGDIQAYVESEGNPIRKHVESLIRGFDQASLEELDQVFATEKFREPTQRQRLEHLGLVRITPQVQPRYPIIKTVLQGYL